MPPPQLVVPADEGLAQPELHEAAREEVEPPVVVVVEPEALVVQPGAATPAFCVTSVKVPSPLLWYRMQRP